MRDISRIENIVNDSFKVLNGLPAYISLEQKEKPQRAMSAGNIMTIIDFLLPICFPFLTIPYVLTQASVEYPRSSQYPI
ncbi:hypothetical protein J2S10_003669 [Neobacillus ginsengisoli]|uniref:Uncharacterized protein n=1 Tax=Neobacillus ginsengisoli TaxID=904295 RepID=A0ABT9XY33_9BACI|nr:hypothetical protein [Neobacillus ginsengisoli]